MSKFEGKNSLTARKMFLNRSYYDAYAYSDYPGRVVSLYPKNTLNSWHRGFMLYGKVDQSQYEFPIEPYKPYMKSLSTKTQSVQVLNFVADAFKAFQKEFLLQIQAGKLSANDPILSEINAVKGYVSVDKLHHEVLKSFSDKFETYSRKFDIKSNINGPDDFIKEVVYLLETYPGTPFTRSGFVMSRFCPSLISGMSIEIASAPYSEDKFKKEMIDTPNFKGFVELASKYGFMVDKNIPWRLTARIGQFYSSSSEEYVDTPMLGYIKQYNPDLVSVQDIINYYFVRSASKEIENLKNYMLKLYNQFVQQNPINATIEGPPENLTKHRLVRPQLTFEDFNNLYGDDYWIELYIRIRNKETGLDYPKPALDAIIRVAKDIQKTVDTTNAIGYTSSKFSGFDFVEGSLAHKTEELRQRKEGIESRNAKEIVTAKARSTRKVFF